MAPSSWWQRLRPHVSITNALTTLFLAYVAWTFRTLAAIAAPSIPSVRRADGSLKPVLAPLWATAPELQLDVVLSSSQYRGHADAAKSELLAVRLTNLSFAAMAAQLELDIHLVRSGGGDDASDEAAGGSGGGDDRVVGLRVTCRHDGVASGGHDGVSPEAAGQCIRAWREWAAANGTGATGAAGAAAAAVHAPGAAGGWWRPAARVLGWDATGALNERERAPAGTLPLGEWRTPAAVRIGRALTRGAPVFAHASLGWVGHPPLQPAAQRHIPPPPPLAASAAAGWRAFDPLRVASASAALVGAAAYEPRKPTRYLWVDPFGTATPPTVHAANGSVVDRGAALAPAPATAGAAAQQPTAPTARAPWPHWLGQLSLHVVTALEPLPRDELPRAIASHIRTDAGRSVHVPLLVANPVRPTRDSLAPLNATLASLPLRVSLAQSAVGKWQLLALLDASVTTQQSMGATEKDTDDVIRMLAETPLWLLALTFVISFVHLLFDVLALKHDVAFWQTTASLAGISVKSLAHQLVSNAIISLYLWSEGSSLLVLLPQAANTLLFAWKIAKASGWQLGLAWRVLPTLRYSRALHASASTGAGSSADAEAVRYMMALLAPLLVGFAAFQFVYAPHVSWGAFLLTTAVSAVYGAGFALMTPQLYVNYRLKSVAHLPWRVLTYRFVNTFIDDVFAAIIRMPLMHRISVFRDDVVFIAYLVQRRIYPVDANRQVEGYETGEEGGGQATGDATSAVRVADATAGGAVAAAGAAVSSASASVAAAAPGVIGGGARRRSKRAPANG